MSERRIERDGSADEPAEGEDVEVPFDRLSAAAQRGVIEEYVTREGTDYGEGEVDLATKVAQVRRQIDRGEVVVLFQAKTGTVNLVARRDLPR